MEVDEIAKRLLESLDRETAVFALATLLAANRRARRLTEGQIVECTKVDRLLVRALAGYGENWLDEYDAAKRSRRPSHG